MLLSFSPVGIFVSLVSIGLCYLLFKWYYKIRRFSHIPTAKHLWPIVGHIFRVPKDISKILDFNIELFEETKSKVRLLWLSFLPIVGVYDLKILESLLKSNIHITKGATYLFVADWLRTGLITSDGEKWKTRRRLLTPAFHFGILKSSADIINHHANFMVDHLKAKIKIDTKQEMQALFKSFSLAVICESAMGVRCNLFENNALSKEELGYLTAVSDILDLFVSRLYKPLLHNNFIYKYLSSEGKRFHKAVDISYKFVSNVIESRIKILEEDVSKKSSIFVDILIDAYKKNEIDIEGIIEEVNTFMFAGHDTVSTALSWTLYLIGKDKDVEDKLYEEIKSLDFDNFTKESVTQLKYLDCVTRESLRLHPPVPIVSRFFKEDAIVGGEKIPAGSTMGMHFYMLHKDETLWKNPSKFLPERFLEYDSEKKNPYAYSPFSAGPRNCIGQRFALLELKMTLCHMVRNFRFNSLQEECDMGIYSTAVLRAKNGIWLEVSERK